MDARGTGGPDSTQAGAAGPSPSPDSSSGCGPTADPQKLAAVRSKVEKLLRQAADREGTPEGEVFQNKAFELMAQYGVEANHATAGERATVVSRKVTLAGTYTDLQFELLNTIASALHCHVVCFRVQRSTRVTEAVVFGRQHHVDRVDLLHTLLNPHMISGASDAVHAGWFTRTTPQTQKRSWMRGFAQSVGQRLRHIESARAGDYAAAPAAPAQGGSRARREGELVLLRDQDAALDAVHRAYPNLRMDRGRRPRTFDPSSYRAGSAAGEGMDLGQTRVHPGARAIGK